MIHAKEGEKKDEIMVDDLGPSGFPTNALWGEIVYMYLVMEHSDAV